MAERGMLVEEGEEGVEYNPLDCVTGMAGKGDEESHKGNTTRQDRKGRILTNVSFHASW